MADLARSLAVLAIIVSVLIPAIGFLRGQDLQQMIVTWLALTFPHDPGPAADHHYHGPVPGGP